MSAISLVQVEGLTLAASGFDEPRVRDVDVGERLGYRAASDIRQVIRGTITIRGRAS